MIASDIDPAADIVSVDEWMQLRNAQIFHFDGLGKFVREGRYTTDRARDDVFGEIPAEVTHIAWVNRWKFPRIMF